MSNLTISQLGRRLGSGTKVIINKIQEPAELVGMAHDYVTVTFKPKQKITGLRFDTKPILYDHSWLTKEITHNGETFVPIVELAKIHGFKPKKYTIEDENGTLVLYGEWIKHPYKNLRLRSFFEIDLPSLDFDYGSQYEEDVLKESFFPVKNQIKLLEKLISWRFRIDEPEGSYIPVTNEFNPYK